MSNKYVLLTGATGLLGRYLLRDLLRDGYRVAVIVRPQEKATAEERVEQIMQLWERQLGHLLPRPICIGGDITEPNVTEENSRQWIADHCDCVLHSAASLQFHNDNVEPWRTNVEGTRNVIQLCSDTSLKVMHYISTAYVCGDRAGRIREDELAEGQGFKTDYEKSKYQAELMVRAHPWESLTVYRPVVITGDSETGYTSTYHGTYLYMRMTATVCRLFDPDEQGQRHIPVRWGIRGDERRNITPVNWNSTVICQLFSNPDAHGSTYHLAPGDPITMREAMALANEFYGVKGIECLGFGKDVSKLDPPVTDLEKQLWASISVYGDYDFADPEFDTTNLLRFAADIPCPKLDSHVGRRLLNYAEEDRWGKRREPPPTPPSIVIPDALGEVAQRPPDFDGGKESHSVGLTVAGPGGGQWNLTVQNQQVVAFDLGLSADTVAIIELVSHELTPANFAGVLSDHLRQVTAQLAQ